MRCINLAPEFMTHSSHVNKQIRQTENKDGNGTPRRQQDFGNGNKTFYGHFYATAMNYEIFWHRMRLWRIEIRINHKRTRFR